MGTREDAKRRIRASLVANCGARRTVLGWAHFGVVRVA